MPPQKCQFSFNFSCLSVDDVIHSGEGGEGVRVDAEVKGEKEGG